MKSLAPLTALLSLAAAQALLPRGGGGSYGGGGNGGGGGGHGGPGGHGGHGGGGGGGGGGHGGHGGNGQCVNRPAHNTPGLGDAVLTADEVRALGNNSLFTRWRPYAHFNAPAGWMNDPCGPMYDPTRDIYHMFYQWHPLHINWGNISWGYATSKDLITWTDHGGWQGREALALGPEGNGTYDGLGIFSGTAQPVNLQGEVDGTLLLFYTSVSYLPTGWRIYYQPYTETQSYAISTDGGDTWQRYEGNPVINATTNTAPMYWNVTGFRDPFFHPWTELDEVLDKNDPHYYAVMGSGIKGPNVQFGPGDTLGTISGYIGPRIPLWSAPSSDLTEWTFEGALWEPTPNSTLGTYLSTGSYGYNFEVSGFFSLYDSNGDLHYYINMGSEGGNTTFHTSLQWALWNEGTVTRRANGSAEFHPIAGGAGDWGLGYAITSFNDTKNDRRIKWNWVREDLSGDGGIFSATQQGFQGALAIPLEYFVHETANVVATAELTQSKSASYLADGTTATTLGQRVPSDILSGLRSCARRASYKVGKLSSSRALGRGNGAAYEFGFTVTGATGSVGARIQTSPNGQEFTTITFNPNNNTITVDRTSSSLIDEFANYTVTGYFAPYEIKDKGLEAIVMSIFVDGSLVEIHANDRFLLSTRVYPAQLASTGFGLYVASGASATFSNVYSYVGLSNVWPSRPQNSSSELVYDTPAETNNYIWWPGN